MRCEKNWGSHIFGGLGNIYRPIFGSVLKGRHWLLSTLNGSFTCLTLDYIFYESCTPVACSKAQVMDPVD